MKTSLKKLGLTRKEILESDTIFQTHFGDYLKKEIEISEDEKYRIFQSHKENVEQGEKLITLEYFGIENGYVWQTVKTYN